MSDDVTISYLQQRIRDLEEELSRVPALVAMQQSQAAQLQQERDRRRDLENELEAAASQLQQAKDALAEEYAKRGEGRFADVINRLTHERDRLRAELLERAEGRATLYDVDAWDGAMKALEHQRELKDAAEARATAAERRVGELSQQLKWANSRYRCAKCSKPVADGFCCTFCGASNPREA